MIQGVLFDLIGTTVKEQHNDIVITCLEYAFSSSNIIISKEFLTRNRGKDKTVMIREALAMQQLPAFLENDIYNSFKKNFERSIERFTENTGAADLFQFLKTHNIKIGIGTGLERSLFEMIYKNLGWRQYSFDYVGISKEVGKSRPHPDMIFDFMNKNGIQHPQEVLKVGDTVADIEEGKNAGVITAAILSGSQAESALLAAKPHYIIRSLVDLKLIIGQLMTL